jgi:hypothetical protein
MGRSSYRGVQYIAADGAENYRRVDRAAVPRAGHSRKINFARHQAAARHSRGDAGAALSVSGVSLQAFSGTLSSTRSFSHIRRGGVRLCAFHPLLSLAAVQVMAFAGGIIAVALAYATARTQGEISRLPLILSE